MSGFNLSFYFPNSGSKSTINSTQKFTHFENSNNNFTNKIRNNSSMLVLPQLDRKINHKKLTTYENNANNFKKSDNFATKEALIDWLVGKKDISVEEIIKNKNSSYVINQDEKVSPANIQQSGQLAPKMTVSKRRYIQGQRSIQEFGDIGSYSTLDSSNNPNKEENQNQQSAGFQLGGWSASAQSIQLPRILEIQNNQNRSKDDNERITILNNNGSTRRLVKKVSIDIFDDNKQQAQTQKIKEEANQIKNSSQQMINFSNQYANQQREELADSKQTSTLRYKRLSNLETYNNTTNQPTNQLHQRNSSLNSLDNINYSPLETNFKSNITQNFHYGSLQFINIPSNSNQHQKNNDIFSNEVTNRVPSSNKHSRRIIASSMGCIPLPEQIKQQIITKSILKDKSNKNFLHTPKKSVNFNEKIQAFPI